MPQPHDEPAVDTWSFITLIKRQFEGQVGGLVANRLPIRLTGNPTAEQLRIISKELNGWTYNGWMLGAREGGRLFVINRA